MQATKKITSFVMSLCLIVASATTFAGSHSGMSHNKKDIVDVAVSNPQFSTLVTALKAADLVDALKGDSKLTVFAPTNEAFAKLPAGTLETLLKPENKDQLVAVLTYHVVPGQVMAKDVVKINSATSLQGSDIAVKTKNGSVMVDNATVVATDVAASNGVIHVIDSVIIPQAG